MSTIKGLKAKCQDLDDLPEEIREEMSFHLVEHMDDVLEHAILTDEGVSVFKDVPVSAVFEDINLSEHNITQ